MVWQGVGEDGGGVLILGLIKIRSAHQLVFPSTIAFDFESFAFIQLTKNTSDSLFINAINVKDVHL